MNQRVVSSCKTSGCINIRPMYVSSALNGRLVLVSSMSNSTRTETPSDKLETSETKTQNVINSDKQTKSQASSLESTCGKIGESAMSSQTKTNSFEKDGKIYRKEPLMYRDFPNISTRGPGFQNFPQPSGEKVFRKGPGIFYDSGKELKCETESFLEKKSILKDSKKIMNEREGIVNNLEKSNCTNGSDRNADLPRLKESKENPQKSVKFIIKEDDRAHRTQIDNNFFKNEVAKMQSGNSMNTSRPLQVRIIKRERPPNYVQSTITRGQKLKDTTNLNLQKPRILCSPYPREKIHLNRNGPLLYHLPNRDKNAVLPSCRFQRSLLYRQPGIATRGDVVGGRYKFIVPREVIVHPNKTVDRCRAHNVSLTRPTVLVNGTGNLQNSLKTSTFVPFRAYDHQSYPTPSSMIGCAIDAQKYKDLLKVSSSGPIRSDQQQQVQSSSARYQIDLQNYGNLLEVPNSVVNGSSQQLNHQVQFNVANEWKNSDGNTPKSSMLKAQDNKTIASDQTIKTIKRHRISNSPEDSQNQNNKKNASDQHSETTDIIKRQKLFACLQNTQNDKNKSETSDQRAYEAEGTVEKLFANDQNIQSDMNKPNASSQCISEATNMINRQKLLTNYVGTQNNVNKPSELDCCIIGATGGQEHSANVQGDKNIPNACGSPVSEEKRPVKRQKLSSSTQNSHQKQDGNTDNPKIVAAKGVFTKISALLCNIREMLSNECQCPFGLEISLPVWKAELDMCILSADRIKAAISEYGLEKS